MTLQNNHSQSGKSNQNLDKNEFFKNIENDYGVKSLSILDEILPKNKDVKFKIVEFGCAAGHISGTISKRYPKAVVLATDLIYECLKVTKKNYPNLLVSQINADDLLPFTNNSIDIFVSSNLYEHLHNEDQHLCEIHKALKHRGYYLISTPNFIFDLIWFGLFEPKTRGYHQIWGRLTNDKTIAHCNLKTINSLSNKLRKYGFAVDILKRNNLNNTEIYKLQKLFNWLPSKISTNLSSYLAEIWIKMPASLQTTIVIKASKI